MLSYFISCIVWLAYVKIACPVPLSRPSYRTRQRPVTLTAAPASRPSNHRPKGLRPRFNVFYFGNVTRSTCIGQQKRYTAII